jgi:GMP synthase-like glutamine amidotransferase
VQAGDLPDAAAFDGAIITGSAAGVYEDHGWIPPLLKWIRNARGRTRLVGVCFGHQAMAQALGGRVEKSGRGWGVGLHRYRVIAPQPWMTPALPEIALSASHQDQVVVKPEDARVTLASDFTPYAGLAWGDDAISFQPHPEFSRAFTGALVEGRRGRIDTAVVDRALESLEAEDDRAPVADWIRRFLAT